MSRTEYLEGQNPYKNTPALRAATMSMLEVPTGFISILRQFGLQEEVGIVTAQHLLSRVADVIDDLTDIFKKLPTIESHLGRGFESSVFSFNAGNTRWVMKIGVPNGFTSGMLSPSTDEYASMQRWNYKMLHANYAEQLPHILPHPYFIVSPSEINYPSTIQVVPYIDRVTSSKSLSNNQMKQLKDERIKFDLLSREFVKSGKVIPDLIKPSNLIVGQVNDEPHIVLLDIGLFNLCAPTPILNFFAYSALRGFCIREYLESKKNTAKK